MEPVLAKMVLAKMVLRHRAVARAAGARGGVVVVVARAKMRLEEDRRDIVAGNVLKMVVEMVVEGRKVGYL